MKKLFFWITFCAAAVASAQTFDQASQKVQQDLADSLKQLSATRNEIAKEQITLSRDVNKLEGEVIEKTRELERLQRQADNRMVGVNALKAEVKSRRDEVEYISGLLNEFVRTFDTKIHISETQLYADALKEARLSIDDINMTQPEKFDRQMDIVGIAVNRADEVLGGKTYEGKALTNAGVLEPGQFAAIGPVVFFKSQQSDAVGLSFGQGNGLDAVVVELDPIHSPGITGLVTTGAGVFPADASSGKALKFAQMEESVGEHIAKGGIWGMVIIILGIVALILAAFKVLDIAAVKVPPVDTLEGMLYDIDAEKFDEAKAKADGLSGLTGKIYQDAVKNINQRRSVLEEIIFARLLEIRPKLERYLAFVALVAAAAPLLGLLGTVTGMIKTFNLITIFGTGDAKSLSSGISEALVTTELGLAVAIPALLLHGLLNRMAKRKIADLEQGAVSFLNGLEVQKES
ncbi:MotA/TolQ/ExbB proton channel family protein [Rubellicoccus peritrichatus]|uniref:MotA/TolQ/ExbB proton channel family protein n=1 Tax=Rubellicoccus peritrichatus TaxID=3080537 RepID=A0AAQ3QUT3_9BACT|nr:MotA/TolQ/ExbB proton channel family protein [Puniceicoccus sp. CR14]WOO42736.1 MotA/TolQ/ExbB proton channel family protein [Puniceicoccus sp. CR14]